MTVHVIGAGLSGLAAAVALTKRGEKVVVHEGARQAGGRCRSYFDATLGMTIDNGNHLLLSGNLEARAFCRTIGSEAQLVGPNTADFPFVDLADGARWKLRPNAGRLPWWIFAPSRRVPGTRARDYLALGALLRAKGAATIGETMPCEGAVYRRLWQPLLLAALNTDPPESSAVLAGAIIRETLAKGGAACRPLVAAQGLAAAFVDPALTWLSANGAEVRLDHPLRGLALGESSVTALDFGDEQIPLGPADRVILAVPPPAAAGFLPGLEVPKSFRSIVNAHFKRKPPPGMPPILGIVGGVVEWIFAFDDRISITISGADRLLDVPREELVETLWSDVCRALGVEEPLPAWQIIREKRATFAATPAEAARRPGARTRYANLLLAGDWTATGLPATIEGSIRSGNRAATLV
ncbi:Hydroxysqualene dehydroxylase [Beijerinckiaceae bacterium RH CH11]|nr:Hydroxysqualene dehydroxylase [Beijerinckiaceae bacterium RH AL8]VVB42330.1 Hydroxysqualene dehydroxylase [Beijerinckiaceae bacterium RH CH11]